MRKLFAVFVIGAALAACSGGSSGGGTVEGFCTQLSTDNALFNQLGTTATDSEQAIQLFDDLTKKAPSEIKAELETLLKFLKDSIAAASALSVDPSPSNSSSRESQISASSSSLTAASAKLSQFATDKCHLDLGGSSPSDFSTVGNSIGN